MSDFRIGQKVVYVPGNTPRNSKSRRDVGDLLVEGEIYEVRWIGMFEFTEGFLPACKFVGHLRVTQGPADLRDLAVDIPYAQRYFRPIQETSKSVEIFRQIARDVTNGIKREFKENA